ncbi:DUF2189 domain-containing protein [Roseospira visakhapatnamensis]|uniref:Putative membrane protein n=1 Tax=Roseospira visakhapatnamensis TaxID=390880 RepID=A0A7W6RE00_9PROT|nr:DUF2189 domain-containing protein [Roseospira visakhapatnamensis]MBB4266279.1 putative membrane protein [Roseospira visakhapatnamensis]
MSDSQISPSDPTPPPAGAAPASRPLVAPVARLTMSDPWDWLRDGWGDLLAAWPISLGLGLLFTLSGFALTAGLVLVGWDYLITPMIAGFLLVAPALALGFHDISRRLEAGERPTLGTTLLAWRVNPVPLIGFGVALAVVLLMWLRVAALFFAISFPYVDMTWGGLLDQTATVDGVIFLITGTVVGGAFAAVIFAISAVSVPMMLDRQTDVFEALATSVAAVLKNPAAMALWAGLIVVFTQAGLVTLFVGLCVTLPLIGHASWHAYRQAVPRDSDT